jgi:anti-sigma factor RsiW
VTAELNKKDCMRQIIAQRLKSVAASELSNATTSSHVDEDLIAAFVEGRLTDAECQPVLSHLAACGLCRRTSAQFVQLENQIDAETSPATADEEPGRLEALLARLRSAVPSLNEEAVFAYEEPEDSDQAHQSRKSDSE